MSRYVLHQKGYMECRVSLTLYYGKKVKHTSGLGYSRSNDVSSNYNQMVNDCVVNAYHERRKELGLEYADSFDYNVDSINITYDNVDRQLTHKVIRKGNKKFVRTYDGNRIKETEEYKIYKNDSGKYTKKNKGYKKDNKVIQQSKKKNKKKT